MDAEIRGVWSCRDCHGWSVTAAGGAMSALLCGPSGVGVVWEEGEVAFLRVLG